MIKNIFLIVTFRLPHHQTPLVDRPFRWDGSFHRLRVPYWWYVPRGTSLEETCFRKRHLPTAGIVERKLRPTEITERAGMAEELYSKASSSRYLHDHWIYSINSLRSHHQGDKQEQLRRGYSIEYYSQNLLFVTNIWIYKKTQIVKVYKTLWLIKTNTG